MERRGELLPYGSTKYRMYVPWKFREERRSVIYSKPAKTHCITRRENGYHCLTCCKPSGKTGMFGWSLTAIARHMRLPPKRFYYKDYTTSGIIKKLMGLAAKRYTGGG